ncbi:uncharacterized protein LOC142554359 [Primulina tabacum]|uniref:uncharacterized protein LOC142554359 n=1 Tax=Primulina tabacum TaxID=48773 RepID=UPI003F59F429
MASASGIPTAVFEISDPLYILPSDTPGINLISEQLIGGENYGIWSRAMIIALRAKNKLAFVDGSCRRPESSSNTLMQWERCYAIVLSWIMNSVSKEIFSGIVYSTDAMVVWADLNERFDKVNGSRIFSLHREIGKFTQGQNTISTYYSSLRRLWDEYSSLLVLPSCSCESAKKYLQHDQQHKLLQFLMGLNESYVHVRSQILMMNPLPSVGQAFALISQEESHRGMLNMGSILGEAPHAAFYASQDKKKKYPLHCDHCNMSGHTKATCYKLVGYPEGHRFPRMQGRGFGYNPNRDLHQEKGKPRRNTANMTVLENKAATPKCVPEFSFTPEQYAAILKLLDKETSPTASVLPSANIAGPMHWEDNEDW